MKTTAGLTYIYNNIASGAGYMAVSSASGAPSAGDTVLASELTLDGLARKVATVSALSGSAFTVSATFTYTGSTPVTIYKIGIFTASSAGTMVYETSLPSPVTLNASGDTATITDTVTLS